jgi:hypothetical protein
MKRFHMTQDLAPTQPNDSAPNTGTTEVRLNSWEVLIGHVSSFERVKLWCAGSCE